jgi:hypothetical protein
MIQGYSESKAKDDKRVSMELMHELLKQMHSSLLRLEDGQKTIVQRLVSLEATVAYLHVDYANLSIRIDGINDRLTRIEKRLDLVEA